MHRRLLIVSAGITIILGGLLVAFLFVLDVNRPKSHRFVIPARYEGWLCLVFNASDGKPLPKEDGYSLVEFDETGVVRTSDGPGPSQSKTSYMRRASSGRTEIDIGRELGGGASYYSNKKDKPDYFLFWVSTAPRPNEANPKWLEPSGCPSLIARPEK